MTELLALLEQTYIVTLNGITDITFSHIIGTGRFTNNWLFDELINTTDIMFNYTTGTNSFINIWWINELFNTTGITDITFSCTSGKNMFTKI